MATTQPTERNMKGSENNDAGETPATKHNAKTGFLDLSPELRNEIYMICLRSDKDIRIHLKWGPDPTWYREGYEQPRPLVPSLLATCGLIHAEATPVLYGSHRFRSSVFGSASKRGKTFFEAVGQLACDNIRHVEVSGAQTGQLPRIFVALGQCDRLESLVVGRYVHDGRKTEKSWVSQLEPMVKAWQDSRQEADAETILKPLKLWPKMNHPRPTLLRDAITAGLKAVLVKRQKDLVFTVHYNEKE